MPSCYHQTKIKKRRQRPSYKQLQAQINVTDPAGKQAQTLSRLYKCVSHMPDVSSHAKQALPGRLTSAFTQCECNGNRTTVSSVASTQAPPRKPGSPLCLRRTSGPALPFTVTATAPPPAPLAGGAPATACAGGVWCAWPVRITCTQQVDLYVLVCPEPETLGAGCIGMEMQYRRCQKRKNAGNQAYCDPRV